MPRASRFFRQMRMACPYCYERFYRWEILFQCAGRPSRIGTRCTPSDDPAYAARFGEVAQLPVFSSWRRREATHEPCQEATTFRVCPRCHHRLPADFERVRSRMVAVVGSRSSGKTVMLAVLINELRGQVGKRLGLTTWEADAETRRTYAADYEAQVYEERVVPEPTRPMGTRDELRPPLVFVVVDTSGPRGARRRTLLSFFDTAGEDLSSEEGVDNNTRYLRSADAVLLLLDPLQTDGGRGLAPAGDLGYPTPAYDYDAFHVLQRITDLIKRGQRSSTVRKPMAVALSKIDLYRHVMKPTEALRRPEPEESGFAQVDGDDVHAQVERLLHDWDGRRIPEYLQDSYRKFRYFGFSALGHQPAAGELQGAGARPYRVVDPFLWLLTQLGAARTVKGR